MAVSMIFQSLAPKSWRSPGFSGQAPPSHADSPLALYYTLKNELPAPPRQGWNRRQVEAAA
jgi:hypothetical protein